MNNATSTPEATPVQQPPRWYEEYRTSFLAAEAHGFILYGDVHGLAYQTLSHRGFLIAELAKRGRIVVCYDLARGINFPDPNMREEALKLLEIPGTETETATSVDPFEAALAGIGGTQPTGQDPFKAKKPLDALRVIDTLLRSEKGKGKVAALIEYADTICPATDKGIMSQDNMTILVLLQTWARDTALGNRNNPFFLITRSVEGLHADLRGSAGGYKAIEIPLPRAEQRREYIAWYMAERTNRGKAIRLVDLTEEQFSRLTAGLNLRHIEDILLLGAKGEGVTRSLVKARKDAIIATEYSEVAEMLEPIPGGFSAIGGMDRLKEWATTEIIEAIKDGRVDDVVRSALLAGPPGSGKTHFISALAWEVGFNAVSLNLENILGSLVGESERKLKEFFQFAKALAPVMIFLDELDQSDVSRRGNNSGNPVASNLFSAMLRFTGDESLRGKVMFFFASNRPDLIDPALLRRMDAIVPVLLPDENGRCGIIGAQARTQGISIVEDAAAYIAQKSVKYNGSDLASVVRKARKLARRRGERTISIEDAAAAMQAIQPSSPQLADWFSLLAVNACNDRDLLPPDQATLKDDPSKLATQIKQAQKSLPTETMREERSE